MKWHPRRRNRLRVWWGAGKHKNIDWNPKEHTGAHVTRHGIIVLHPKLRKPEGHDECYNTLGHEFLHHVFGEDEALAYRFEKATGQALHDLLVGFTPPKCSCGD